MLTTLPASKSACVTVCVASQVVEAPGANVNGAAGTHTIEPGSPIGSVTSTSVNGHVAVFVTVIE